MGRRVEVQGLVTCCLSLPLSLSLSLALLLSHPKHFSQVLDMMEAAGVAPDVVSYNAMLSGIAFGNTRERVLYWQATGPNLFFHRAD